MSASACGSASLGTTGGSGGPAGQAAPAPKTSSKASANRGRSSRREQSTARRARNASSREPASTAASARAALSTSPEPTRTPAVRSAPASPATRSRTTASDTAEDSRGPHAVQVLADLQRDPERRVEVAVATERRQRAGPRDRLPDAGLLVELGVAQARHRVDDPLDDHLGDARGAHPQDLGLALARRVVDPVVQAAALEGVVELTRAIGGQHDERPAAGADRPELGDRHLEVREQLEQEGLELVVGAVHLVEQQDDGPVVLERFEQRPAQEEAPGEQLALVQAA